MPRIAFRPLSLIAIVGLIAAVGGAKAPTPRQLDEDTARVVVNLLEFGHMAKPRIDDETAKKWCKNFLKDLDPQKYYFEKPDIVEFTAQATTLDDKIKQGNLDFARQVFDRYLTRCDERLKTAMEFLDQKPDFSVDESIVDDPDTIDYPANAAEAKERWRKRVKLDLLQLKVVDKLEGKEAVDKLRIRYKDRNRIFHQFDMSELMEVYLSSLTRTFDPHSSYLSPTTLDDMINQSLHLSLEGIGASLQSEDGYAVVKEVVPGMAADKDGRLQPEDKIVGIQEGNKEIDLVEMRLKDVVRYIRGPRGTKVRLIVIPAGTKERKIYELTRDKIELREQHAKGQVVPSKTEDGRTLKFGVINLPAFYGNTQAVINQEPDAVSATEDCRKLINGFKEQGIDAVILDLRGNGGGLLEEARTLSGLFIDRGPVVQVKDANGVKHIDDNEADVAWSGPLVVLIDHLSASASEIFAGVIKDYGRGLIIGDSSTFGKGTVQSIVPINEQIRGLRDAPNLGALKLTIQQFYRVNGESTQVRGVTPDVHIPSLRDHMDFSEGKMDNALKFDTVDPLPHAMLKRLTPDLVQQLNTRSLDRRKANPKFKKQEERIAKFAERKARHMISLNEDKFRAEFVPEEEDGQGETKPAAKDKPRKKYQEHPAWEPNDFYNEEVLKIVDDYLTVGSKVLASAPRIVSADR